MYYLLWRRGRDTLWCRWSNWKGAKLLVLAYIGTWVSRRFFVWFLRIINNLFSMLYNCKYFGLISCEFFRTTRNFWNILYQNFFLTFKWVTWRVENSKCKENVYFEYYGFVLNFLAHSNIKKKSGISNYVFLWLPYHM